VSLGDQKMKTIVASFLVTALLVNCANAEEVVNSNAIVKTFEARNLSGIQGIRPQVIEKFSSGERNAIALAAAKSLSITEYIGAIGTNSIYKHFTKPPAQDSPEEAECRKQLGINWSAASLLQHLAEKRMIDDAKVLPYLIDALDHPDRNGVGQRCFYALKSLTRQTSGEIYWARLVEDQQIHTEITKWWRDWWGKNKDKHPVFDLEMEGRARDEVLRLSGLIEKQIKPQFAELALFQSPPTLPLRWQKPLFYIEYKPGNWSLAIDSFKGLDRKAFPWILISCRFQSQGLADTWAQEEKLQPPENLRDSVTHCYVQNIAGSDLLIEVFAASKSSALITQMQLLLKTKKDTQPTPAGDVLRAAPEE